MGTFVRRLFVGLFELIKVVSILSGIFIASIGESATIRADEELLNDVPTGSTIDFQSSFSFPAGTYKYWLHDGNAYKSESEMQKARSGNADPFCIAYTRAPLAQEQRFDQGDSLKITSLRGDRHFEETPSYSTDYDKIPSGYSLQKTYLEFKGHPKLTSMSCYRYAIACSAKEAVCTTVNYHFTVKNLREVFGWTNWVSSTALAVTSASDCAAKAGPEAVQSIAFPSVYGKFMGPLRLLKAR